jgi:hypothetical protein
MIKIILFLLFIFAVRTGVCTQALLLAKQAFYHLSHTSNPFFSGYFRNGGSRTICPGWP